jgi:hypothetical protein
MRHVRVGLLATGLAASMPARAETACPPVAVVGGAPEIAAPVAAILRRRGLQSGPSGCGRIVHASLAPLPYLKTYSLHIEDSYGRVSNREIADAGTAASLIESWAIDEDSDVLAPRSTPVPAASVAAAPSPPAPANEAGWRLIGLGELSSATDGSVWYGGGITACGRVGVLCVGGRARIARDGDRGSGELAGYVSRTRGDAGAVAILPLSRGSLSLAPMFGLGVSWMRSAIPIAPLEMTADDFSVAAEVGVGVARTLTQGWSVTAEVGGVVSAPLASRSSEETFSFLPVALPVAPRGLLRVALGVQYAR